MISRHIGRSGMFGLIIVSSCMSFSWGVQNVQMGIMHFKTLESQKTQRTPRQSSHHALSDKC